MDLDFICRNNSTVDIGPKIWTQYFGDSFSFFGRCLNSEVYLRAISYRYIFIQNIAIRKFVYRIATDKNLLESLFIGFLILIDTYINLIK